MHASENSKNLLTASGVGVGIGIAVKMLLDAGTKSKGSSGFITFLNGITFNILSRASEKIGTSQNNILAIIACTVVGGGLHWWLGGSPRKSLNDTNNQDSIIASGQSTVASNHGIAVSHQKVTGKSAISQGSGVAMSGDHAALFYQNNVSFSKSEESNLKIWLYQLGFYYQAIKSYIQSGRYLELPDHFDSHMKQYLKHCQYLGITKPQIGIIEGQDIIGKLDDHFHGVIRSRYPNQAFYYYIGRGGHEYCVGMIGEKTTEAISEGRARKNEGNERIKQTLRLENFEPQEVDNFFQSLEKDMNRYFADSNLENIAESEIHLSVQREIRTKILEFIESKRASMLENPSVNL